MGDIFSVRLAGNVAGGKALGSIEYGCAVAGAKLILVVGHTRCGAVTAAVKLKATKADPAEATGCQHIEHVVRDIYESITPESLVSFEALSASEQESLIDVAAPPTVAHVVRSIQETSQTLSRLVQEGRIAVVGAMYDVVSGDIEFLNDAPSGDQAHAEDGADSKAMPR